MHVPRHAGRPLAALAALSAVFAAGAARADNGYFQGDLGARAAGRGGAFVARADDLTAVEYNPAGLANLPGTIIQFGNRFSYNGYAYTRAPTLDYGNIQNGTAPRVTFAQVRNADTLQAAEPMVGMASKLGLRDWGFALAAYAPPGNSRESFPEDGGQRYMMVSREAIILKFVAAAAWKHDDLFGVGASFQWLYVPSLDYSLIIDGSPFAGADNPVRSGLDMLATIKGSSLFTPNAVVGAWLRPSRSWQFGAAGQVIPTQIVTNSHLTVDPIDTSMGGVMLRRNMGKTVANDVNLTLPLPLLARVGGRYRYLEGERELFDVELDVEYETWSRNQQFILDTHGLSATYNGQTIPINTIDVAKHWQNTVSVKLGGDFAAVPDRLTLRAGGFYETPVSPPAYQNVDFPGGAQMGGSLGTSLLFGSWEVLVAYQLRYQPTVTVSENDGRVYQQVPGSSCSNDPSACDPNLMGKPSPVVNAGSYTAVSHLVSLGVLYRFGI